MGKEVNNEYVKYYQQRFKRWIQSQYWDSIANELNATYVDIISRVMNAEKDSDLSWIVWVQCDNILERIRDIRRHIGKGY